MQFKCLMDEIKKYKLAFNELMRTLRSRLLKFKRVTINGVGIIISKYKICLEIL